MALFKDLDSLQEKVRNPDLLEKELVDVETLLQEVELPSHIAVPPDEDTPQKPLHRKRILRQRRPVVHDIHSGQLLEKARQRFAWRKKKEISPGEPSTATEVPHEMVTPLRSTFTLALDDEGQLMGLPLKKPSQPTEHRRWSFLKRKKDSEESEGEHAKGMKAQLNRLTSKLLRRKTTTEETTKGSGFGEKLKGLFKRTSKE